MSTHSSILNGLRDALLDTIIEGPPAWPGEKWFHADLAHLSREELVAERERLHLRLRLMTAIQCSRWPGVWFGERLERVEALLRTRHAAAGWSRVRQ